jgi:hypothetical protein
MYEKRNSLLPNDPGLQRAGSNQGIDRRNSNESDESDTLSQYFRSPSSRKSSLIATNEISNTELSHEHHQNVISSDHETPMNASRRLQSFVKSSDENRQPRDSISEEPINFKKTEARKSLSALGSFKFSKKKKNSVDLSNQVWVKN